MMTFYVEMLHMWRIFKWIHQRNLHLDNISQPAVCQSTHQSFHRGLCSKTSSPRKQKLLHEFKRLLPWKLSGLLGFIGSAARFHQEYCCWSIHHKWFAKKCWCLALRLVCQRLHPSISGHYNPCDWGGPRRPPPVLAAAAASGDRGSAVNLQGQPVGASFGTDEWLIALIWALPFIASNSIG